MQQQDELIGKSFVIEVNNSHYIALCVCRTKMDGCVFLLLSRSHTFDHCLFYSISANIFSNIRWIDGIIAAAFWFYFIFIFSMIFDSMIELKSHKRQTFCDEFSSNQKKDNIFCVTIFSPRNEFRVSTNVKVINLI